MAALSDVADLIMGQSPPSSTYNEAGDGLVFFQGKTDFGFRHPTPKLYCNAPLKIARPNDILMSVRAPVGPTNIADRECCIGRGLAAIRPRDIDGNFLYFNLRYLEKFIASLGSGSTFHAINKSQLASLEVNPHEFSLPDQAKIAGALGVVQRAMEQQERLLALMAELKRTLLHLLFTVGLRGEPQKQTEIGPVPESWEVVPLGKICSLQGGFAFKSGDYVSAEVGIPILKIGDLQDGEVTLSERSSFVPTSFWEQKSMKSFRLNHGDLLIALTGATTGKTAEFQLEQAAFLNQRVGRFLPKEAALRPAFLKYLVLQSYFQREIQRNILAAAQGNISPKRIEQFLVGVPPPVEQDEIGAALGTLDAKISVTRRKLSALTALFRTLLHRLMTAQIRIHELDLDILECGDVSPISEGATRRARQSTDVSTHSKGGPAKKSRKQGREAV